MFRLSDACFFPLKPYNRPPYFHYFSFHQKNDIVYRSAIIFLVSILSACHVEAQDKGWRPIPPEMQVPNPIMDSDAATVAPRNDSDDSDTPTPQRIPGYIPHGVADRVVYRCFFDEKTDVNQDSWPDGWTRNTGVGFPDYTVIGIERIANPANFRTLRINVEGGATLLRTPKIPVLQGFSYTAKSFVRTEGLQRDNVSVTLSFFNKTGKQLKSVPAKTFRNSGGWREIEIGPVPADMTGVSTMQLAFQVAPDKRQDFVGKVDIAGIEISDGPTVSLTTINRDHIFFDTKNIEVRCRLSGLKSLGRRVNFILEDAFGNILDRQSMVIQYDNSPNNAFVLAKPSEASFFHGRVNWTPPIPFPGFYRVRVEADGLDSTSDSHSIPIAVLRPELPKPGGGIFGWSLPNRSVDEINTHKQLLDQSGISWLKVPVWLGTKADAKQWEDLAELCEWLNRSRNITLVGLLSEPPKEVLTKITADKPNTAGIYSMSVDKWYPSVEPTLIQLALIRYWQLGEDEDRSIAEIDPLESQIVAIRNALNSIAIDVSIGFGWDWNRPIPQTFLPPRQANFLPRGRLPFLSQIQPQSNDSTEDLTNSTSEFDAYPPSLPFLNKTRDGREFLSMSSSFPLTASELKVYLRESETSNIDRFVVLRPISKRDYSLEDRLNDLVHRMFTSKIYGAKAAFIPEPWDDDTGLLNTNGTPGELYLPFRTTALMLSGKEYVGKITLPLGSENLIFSDGQTDVMVLWNEGATADNPIEETLFLGPESELVDLWGKSTRPYRNGMSQIIPVGSIPVFLSGVNSQVTKFRQGFSLDKTRIPSLFGQKVPNGFTFANNSSGGIGLTATIVPPPNWLVSPQTKNVNIAEGEKVHVPFDITLTSRAESGPQQFRIDFRVAGVPTDSRNFSVYETMYVGDEEVYLEPLVTKYNAKADILEVRQALVNNSSKAVSFAFSLAIPGRQKEKSMVLNLGFGRKEHTYLLKNGKNLLGKQLMITGTEIGGARKIQHTFQAIR